MPILAAARGELSGVGFPGREVCPGIYAGRLAKVEAAGGVLEGEGDLGGDQPFAQSAEAAARGAAAALFADGPTRIAGAPHLPQAVQTVRLREAARISEEQLGDADGAVLTSAATVRQCGRIMLND